MTDFYLFYIIIFMKYDNELSQDALVALRHRLGGSLVHGVTQLIGIGHVHHAEFAWVDTVRPASTWSLPNVSMDDGVGRSSVIQLGHFLMPL